MSRIEVLKKQNPSFNVNFIDLVSKFISKPKYVELLVKLTKNKIENRYSPTDEFLSMIESNFGFKFEEKEKLNKVEVLMTWIILNETCRRDEIRTFKKFIEFNERSLIKENDLSKYDTFEKINQQVSISELLSIDKEIEKQVIKLYEDEKYLLVKPLSWVASKKYGANTKWCTTAENEPEHFYRYTSRGILIYFINKENGFKCAVYREIINGIDSGDFISFWNMEDNRVDSMLCNIPSEMMELIKKEILGENLINNLDLLNNQEKFSQITWLKEKGYKGDYINLSPHSDLHERGVVPVENPPNVIRLNRIREVRGILPIENNGFLSQEEVRDLNFQDYQRMFDESMDEES